MKKLLSFLLALTLSFSLATFALADNEGGAAQFDPRLTITEKRDAIVVNVCATKENAEILAEKQPTLTVACGYARAVVTDPNGMQIEAALKDGKISFVVATVGNYTIKRVSASASKPAAGSGKTDEPSHDDAAPAETYPDVKKSDWHYEAVQFVTEEKLMTGTGKGFEPDAATTRAMLWTILARMDGTEVSAGNGAWYAAAQQWAEKTGVSDGTNPDGKITREQLATMLYRYAKERGMVKADAQANLSTFADGAAVSPYAAEAMRWAVAVGIVNGMDGKLVPQGEATRAQMAAMLMRYAKLAG